ncbi:MAG: carbon-nitrogen hydrolase family protein [Alphaproteobacteria bacterium]|nr:carbon-nitrogen hydrolase family protein [Alphaproteobacteria bacterium]
MKVRVAAAQYPIDAIASWEAYAGKIARWVGEAAGEGAQLLLFPEYAAMEAARMFAPEVWSDLQSSIDFVGGSRGKIDALHAELAEKHQVYIVASSLPVRDDDGVATNIARVISPRGRIAEQRKLIMTRFEREQWRVQGGRDVNVFDTRIGTFGVAICYDVEFPLIARAMSDAGAAMILVPSCTDTLHGYHRVRVGAQARALENQCYVVHAPTVGEAPWSPAVDRNVGAAGVYGPPDLGFPDDGVVARGRMNEPMWLYAELDLTAITRVRMEGAVFNDKHWREQPGAATLPAGVIEL